MEERGGQSLAVPAAPLFKTSKNTPHLCVGEEWEIGAWEQVL